LGAGLELAHATSILLPDLASNPAAMQALRKIVFGLCASTCGAIERAVGKVIGAAMIEGRQVLINDKVRPEFFAAASAASFLIEH